METPEKQFDESAASEENQSEVVEEESQSVDTALAESSSEEDRSLGRGEALSIFGANRIAAEQRTTVVVLAGGPNCGKTTLLAAIYERFGRGMVGGHYFLGSKTLHGFEMRCHRSLHGQGPGGGSEGHTASDAPPWLHLRVARQEDPRREYELLLGDFSGDFFFTPIADGSRLPSEFPPLRRADHVCFTVNGGALAEPQLRAAEHRMSVDLLKALVADEDGIAGLAAISFVVTKWDLVVKQGSEAREAVSSLFEDLRSILPDRLDAEVGFIETAARSTASDLPIGFGVADLLGRWTDQPTLHVTHQVEGEVSPGNWFDRYEVLG
jgi:double-GTPase-like protein